MRGKKALTITLGLSLAITPGLAYAGAGDTGKSTLQETIKRKGTGFMKLVPGPGENYTVRSDITGPKSKRAKKRQSMVFFGQLTDPQIADEMSPARLEPVDPAAGPISAAWRPQETLGVHVFDAIVRNMNANKTSYVESADGSRAELGFVVMTGDVADSQQRNEVRYFRKVLDGKEVDPYSGVKITDEINKKYCDQGLVGQLRGAVSPDWVKKINKEVENREYVGVQDFTDWWNLGDEQRRAGFWDPDRGGPASNEYGYSKFPKYPGMLDRAQENLNAAGLDVPWYITRGNHDTLVQGNIPANFNEFGLSLSDIAVGCYKPWPNVKLDPNQLKNTPGDEIFQKLIATGGITGLIDSLQNGRPVAPDPDRRHVSKYEFKKYVGKSDNQHGFGWVSKSQNKSSNQNASYYGFNRGKFRFIVLDTNAEGGGANGNLDNPQFQWLKKQLDKYSQIEIKKNGKIKRDKGKNKLLIISSHHTLGTMDNPTPDEAPGLCKDWNNLEPGCDSDPRDSKPIHLADARKDDKGNTIPGVTDLLLKYPNVVAYVNGHTHHNAVRAFTRDNSAKIGGGFWQINTASHIDWPQQSRTIEFFDNKDNTMSIFGTILNSAGDVKSPKPGTSAKKMDQNQLVALSRRLSANDPQMKDVTEGGGLGKKKDRNVELIVKDPRKYWK